MRLSRKIARIGNSLHSLVLAGLVAGCSPKQLKGSDAGVTLDLSTGGVAATMLAPASTLTHCLAVDDKNAYWADFAGGTATIMRAPLGGGGATALATGGDKYACVVTDGTGAVYYTDDVKGSIVKATTSGATKLLTGQNVLGGLLAVAGGSIYWISDVYGNVDAYNGNNAILSLATTGGAINVVDAQVAPGTPGGLAVAGMTVFYSDDTGAFGRTLAMPMQPISFGTSILHTNKLAVGGTHLALTEANGVGSGDVAVFKLDGTGRVVVSPALQTPLAVDDSGVYVDDNGQLARLALDGSGATILATAAPLAVALGPSTVYFLTGAGLFARPK